MPFARTGRTLRSGTGAAGTAHLPALGLARSLVPRLTPSVALSLVLGLAQAGAAPAADLAPASPALCRPAQQVLFHCSLGDRSVSLCADKDGDRIASLGYRYGRPGRIEQAQDAADQGEQRFKATQSPLAPSAKVRQLWFQRGGNTVLLSQCIGGGCPYSAGLALLRGDRLLSNRRCRRTADDRAFFAPELARFGPDAADSASHTARLVFEDTDQGVDRLYPTR